MYLLQIDTMAASGISLAPIRLSELKPIPSATKKYSIPNKRSAPDITSLDLVGNDFPTLGVPMELHENKEPMQFKRTILDLIAKDQMDEIERNRQREIDPSKMSRSELESTGWVILRIYPDIGRRFNEFIESIPKMYRPDEELY